MTTETTPQDCRANRGKVTGHRVKARCHPTCTCQRKNWTTNPQNLENLIPMDIIYIERINRKSIQGTAYSISSAGRALGMDRRSLYPYMRIAYLYVADYRIAKKAADKFSPKQPLLNGYMVWVLGKIKQIFAIQGNRKLAIATIKSRPQLLSLETYENEQENPSQRTGHDDGGSRLAIA